MIDIKKFCAIGDIRIALNAPFIIGDKLAASDGNVMVVMPNDGMSDYKQYPEPGNIERVINIIESASSWVTVDKSAVVFPEKLTCGECDGTGKSEKNKCKECDGEGEVDLENDYNTYFGLECKSCGGDGYEVNKLTDKICEKCSGTGKVDQFMSAVEILCLKIQVKYLRLIIDEENLEFAVDDKKEKLIFRCGDGITGAIMAIRV